MDKSGKKNSRGIMIMKVLLFSYIITGILLLALALLLFKFDLKENVVSIGIIVIYVLATLIGGWLVGRGVDTRKFLWGAVFGILYCLVLMTISLLVHRGFEKESGNLITTLLMCAGAGTVGGMLAK